MEPESSERFDGIAGNYRTSEVHRGSPTIDRLHALVGRPASVCDVASGAGHTGLSFAGIASTLVAVDPAPNMLRQCRELASERGVAVQCVQAFAESIPLPANAFDLVVCRLAAHHFKDIAQAMREMTRIAKPNGLVAVIDMEGDENPEIDALNHRIEVLHDPTHVRSYTAARWRELFAACGLTVRACETRCREIPGGMTVGRWCELGASGDTALRSIQEQLRDAPAQWLASLDITRDPDGEFRLPIRTLLIIGQKTDQLELLKVQKKDRP